MHQCRTLQELVDKLLQWHEEVDVRNHSIEYLFGFADAREWMQLCRALQPFQRCNT